jgi:hypothetical protein
MSSRKSKLTQVDAQQLPFEGYGPSENNVLNPLSITDWATWFTKWYEWFFVNTEITRSRGNFPFPELPSSEYQSRWMLLGELNPQGTILEGFLSSSSSSSSSSGSSSSDCSAYDNEAVLFTNIWYCTSGSTL